MGQEDDQERYQEQDQEGDQEEDQEIDQEEDQRGEQEGDQEVHQKKRITVGIRNKMGVLVRIIESDAMDTVIVSLWQLGYRAAVSGKEGVSSRTSVLLGFRY